MNKKYKIVKMTEDQWIKEYKPIKNPHEKEASFDGYMFETYGKELAQVLVTEPTKVWTYVEGKGGELYIKSGLETTNKLGYFVTEKACEPNTDVQVETVDEASIILSV